MFVMGRGTLFVFVVGFLAWKETHGCFTTSTMETVYVKTGSDYYNECECNSPGYDMKSLQWLDIHNQKIGLERPGTGQRVFTVVNTSCCVNLHIPYVTKDISGVYKCVTNIEGQDYEQLHNLVAYDPITINPPEKQYLILGNTSMIKCEVHAEPHAVPLVTWYKDEDGTLTKINQNEKYKYAHEGLYVYNVTIEDKGKYSCTALDIMSTDSVDKDIDVEVIISPAISALTAIPSDIVVYEDELKIECIADGTPHPEYIFRKIDGEPTNSSRWVQGYNTIAIEKVIPEDQGTYECIAQSLAGVVSKTVFIQVQVPPKITSFPNITAHEGQTIQLVCNTVGRPEPNVSIIFVDKDSDIHDLDDNHIYQNLAMIKITRDHKGIYICNASNEVDFTLEFMYLTVEYPPRFHTIIDMVWSWEGKVVNLNCSFDSNPPAKLTWRYQSNEISTQAQIGINKEILTTINDTIINVNSSADSYPYGVYECKAVNSYGEDTKFITFKDGHVPSPIVMANASLVEYTSATFVIQGPDTVDGPEIQGYTSEYDKVENYNVTHIHINRTWSIDRPYSIDELEPNTTYLIRFAAINEVGNGLWSPMLEFTTLEPSIPSVPDWEIDSDFVAITDMNQKICWHPTNGNGMDVQYYTIKYCLNMEDQEEEEKECNEAKVHVNEELKLDVSLLEFNTTYFVYLIAHNAIGDSEPANLTALMLVEPLPPAAMLSAGALIGISIVVVFICLLFLDLLLLMWRRQGIIASCCVKKKKSKAKENLHTRDKKGLLKDNREPEETLRPDKKHKEFEYNKTTGIITGRHSAV